MSSPAPADTLARARRVLDLEIAALAATRDALDARFTAAVALVRETLAAGRKLLFLGVGKSACVAQKLAGTFNSIGAPACFLDATAAMHGDLGLCAAGDLALAVSNSGRTEELLRLLPLLRRFDVRLVAITSQPDSPLAARADATLACVVPEEACPLHLAPTASTTAALALGDALAMVVLQDRGLSREDFARYHPSGTLGLSLLLRVRDIMRTGDRFPRLAPTATLQEAIFAMTAARAGSLAVVDPASGRLSGILTDGDFRRAALRGGDFLAIPVAAAMTPRPVTVPADALATEAARLLAERHIDDLLAVEADGTPAGLVDGQDLPRLQLG